MGTPLASRPSGAGAHAREIGEIEVHELGVTARGADLVEDLAGLVLGPASEHDVRPELGQLDSGDAADAGVGSRDDGRLTLQVVHGCHLHVPDSRWPIKTNPVFALASIQ